MILKEHSIISCMSHFEILNLNAMLRSKKDKIFNKTSFYEKDGNSSPSAIHASR